jgi:hypothetical protein
MNQKNEAGELRTLLFTQMNRLADPANDLDKELKRADALAKVGTVIVNSHKQEIDMLKLEERGSKKTKTIQLNPVKNNKAIGNGK